MNFDYYKYHALGNDYIVIDPQKRDVPLSAGNVKLICHRNFGIGSDGILYGPIEQEGIRGLRIFNPDGSEAEKSGNGLRIFSRYLDDAGYLSERNFDLMTPGGKVRVALLDKKNISVNMGKVSFRNENIPVTGMSREVVNEKLYVGNRALSVTCLSIGNPHCIVPMENVSRDIAEELGPQIENHPWFPSRINGQFMRVIDRHAIAIEIWERGAGYTLASGSSSCAAASAAYKLGLVDRAVRVQMPGGTITIDLHENGDVLMTGEVSEVGKGIFSEELWAKLKE
jgi:diaminopimelate epimerase